MNTITTKYQGLPINSGKDGTLTCRENVLYRIKERMDYMTSRHSKVFFVRFDVTLPKNVNVTDPEVCFRSCFANFIKNRKRKYGTVHYVWVKEIGGINKALHWHVILLFNGSKTQNIHGHFSKLEELWCNALGVTSKGLIDRCDRAHPNGLNNGIMIIRNREDFQSLYEYCFHWASYLAKTNSKETLQGRCFGCSELIKKGL